MYGKDLVMTIIGKMPKNDSEEGCFLMNDRMLKKGIKKVFLVDF